MKLHIIPFVLLLLILNGLNANAQSFQPQTQEDSVFYSFGVLVGQRFFPQSFYPEFNTSKLVEAIKDFRTAADDFKPNKHAAGEFVQEFNKMVKENPNMSFDEATIDSACYYFGILVADRFFPVEFYKIFAYKAFGNGVSDARDSTFLISLKDAEAIVMSYNQQLQEEANAESIKEQRDFLTANAKKEGVITTASGLQYKVIREGTGTTFPTATDTVKTTYKGWLISGDIFDAGQDIEFPLNMVIPGWTEGIQLMTTGAKFEFYIPSDLGYGQRGTQGIPPHTLLIFEVELLEIHSPN